MTSKIKQYLTGDFAFRPKGFDYERYWMEAPREIIAERIAVSKLELLKEMIAPDSNVLEIGCGDGLVLEYLMRTRNIQASGIDISDVALSQAGKKGIKTLRADVMDSNFEVQGTFDYILLSEVLEHLPRPESLLVKLHGRYSKEMVITIPNVGYIGERMRLLLGRFPKQWVIHPSEHLRFWTVRDFRFWCAQLGFKVVLTKGVPDEDYDKVLKLWARFPNLFARYVLYVLEEA